MKIFTSKTQAIGEIGETAAAAYLKKEGFTIIERNAANKYGEIDIVARKGKIYYFFEVKAGKQGGFINPAENLTREKLRKVFISVEHYCLVKKIKEYRIQGILVLIGVGEVKVEIIELF